MIHLYTGGPIAHHSLFDRYWYAKGTGPDDGTGPGHVRICRLRILPARGVNRRRQVQNELPNRTLAADALGALFGRVSPCSRTIERNRSPTRPIGHRFPNEQWGVITRWLMWPEELGTIVRGRV